MLDLYVIFWFKNRVNVLKDDKTFYYSLIGGKLFYCILFIAFFAFGLVITLLSGSTQIFDWKQNINTLLGAIGFFLFQMSFVMAVDFMAGVEIRQFHFKRKNKPEIKQIFPLIFDIIIFLFGIGFFFDVIFLFPLVKNQDIISSIFIRTFSATIYGIIVYLEVNSIYDLEIKIEYEEVKNQLESSLKSLLTRMNEGDELNPDIIPELRDDLASLGQQLSFFEKDYVA